jgi:hypothetical protein
MSKVSVNEISTRSETGKLQISQNTKLDFSTGFVLPSTDSTDINDEPELGEIRYQPDTKTCAFWNGAEWRELEDEEAYTKSGLILDLDAGNKNSYPGSGTIWSNMAPRQKRYKGVLSASSGVSKPSFSTLGGGSLNFNGSTHYVKLTDGLEGSYYNTQSLEMWVRNTNNNSVEWFAIGSGGVDDLDECALWGTNGTQVRYICFVNPNSSRSHVQVVHNFTYADDNWHHFLGTWTGTDTGGTARLYIDGEYVAQSTTVSTNSTIDNYGGIIGGSPYNGTNYKHSGQIAIVRAYNRQLAPSEVRRNYLCHARRFGHTIATPPSLPTSGLQLHLDIADRACHDPEVINLIGQSENLVPTAVTPNGTAWNQQGNVTVTSNDTTAPDGTTTADKYNISQPFGRRLEYRVYVEAGKTYNTSVWLKRINANATWTFQLFNQGIVNASYSWGSSSEYTPADSNWNRINITFTATQTGYYFMGGYDTSGTTGDMWHMWGWQMTETDTVQDYIYTFNGAAGYLRDLSGNGVDFDVSGGVKYDEVSGGALRFNGYDAYCEPHEAWNVDFTTFSIMCWFRTSTPTNYQNPYDANYNVYPASGNVGPRVEMYNRDGSAYNSFAMLWSGNTTTNGTYNAISGYGYYPEVDGWFCHIVTLNSSNTANLYINGYNYDTETGTNGWVNSFGRFSLGRGFHLGNLYARYFTGHIGAVAVWNRELTSAEALQAYNHYKNRFIT